MYNQGAPMDYVIWQLVLKTGWTWEYIEEMPVARLHAIEQINDAEAKSRKSVFNKR